jgi:hypothetical protein
VTAKKKAAKPRKAKSPKAPKKIDNRSIQAEAILDLIANRKTTLTKACNDVGVGISTFLKWVRNDTFGLRQSYEEAREAYFMALAEECLEIADDSSDDFAMTKQGPILRGEHVQRSALRISTRKWLCEVGAKPRTGYGRDTDEDDTDTVNAAIAALERIATAKAVSV